MAITEELAALIKRYRRTPEFMFSDLTDVNSTGMTGDTLLHSAVISGSRENVDLLSDREPIICGRTVINRGSVAL